MVLLDDGDQKNIDLPSKRSLFFGREKVAHGTH